MDQGQESRRIRTLVKDEAVEPDPSVPVLQHGPSFIQPLLMSEIIAIAVRHVPLWVQSGTDSLFTKGQEYHFHPKDLLACSAVCKLWRAEVLPVLWYCYDDVGSYQLFKRIPKEVFEKYSHHVRMVCNWCDWDESYWSELDPSNRPTFLNLNRLVYLSFMDHAKDTLALLQANPDLETAVFYSDDDTPPPATKPLFNALCQLKNLRVLDLGVLVLQNQGELWSILESTPRLQILKFKELTWEGESETIPRQHLSLESLTIKKAMFVDMRNILLLLSICPHLTHFGLEREGVDDTKDWTTLATALEQDCPRIRSLDLGMGDVSGCGEEDMDKEYSAVISACSELQALRLQVIHMGESILKAILAPRMVQSLVSLSLECVDDDSPGELSQILSIGCPLLETFEYGTYRLQADELIQDLFVGQPQWATSFPNLRRVLFQGVVRGFESEQARKTLPEGWTMSGLIASPSSNDRSCLDRETWKVDWEILTHLHYCSKLTQVAINSMRYTRIVPLTRVKEGGMELALE